MTLEDFQVASFEKKCGWITGNSSYLTCREYDKIKTYLYHTGDYFVEVHYSVKFKRVTRIGAFQDVESLWPYAETVSLDELFD
jgi:hypothetical protein